MRALWVKSTSEEAAVRTAAEWLAKGKGSGAAALPPCLPLIQLEPHELHPRKAHGLPEGEHMGRCMVAVHEGQ